MIYQTHTYQSAKALKNKKLCRQACNSNTFHDHITPILQKLHWLIVRYCIMYKILILTHKCIHELVPLYLQELIQKYVPTRNLRSSSKLNLVSATVSFLTYGHRSFSKASAELWNNVKNCKTLCQFKSFQNTHLFKV